MPQPLPWCAEAFAVQGDASGHHEARHPLKPSQVLPFFPHLLVVLFNDFQENFAAKFMDIG